MDVTASDTVIAKWSDAQTRLLISVYRKMTRKKDFLFMKKHELWRDVADKLGIGMTATNCENRWKTLMRGYKKAQTLNRSPRSRQKPFMYQAELESIIHEVDVLTESIQVRDQQLIFESAANDSDTDLDTPRGKYSRTSQGQSVGNAEEVSVASGHDGFHWTHEQTVMLIAAYKKINQRKAGRKITKGQMWREVAQTPGIGMTDQQCQNRWKTLTRHYNKLQANNFPSDRPFFYRAALEEIFSNEGKIELFDGEEFAPRIITDPNYCNVDDDDEGGVTAIVEDSKAPLRFLKFPDQSEEDEAELREKSVRLSDAIPVSWTVAQTRLLIAQYEKTIRRIREESLTLKRWQMWQEIANELSIGMTANQCENRWKTLLRAYKKKVHDRKYWGGQPKPFLYQAEMDAILSEDDRSSHEETCSAEDGEASCHADEMNDRSKLFEEKQKPDMAAFAAVTYTMGLLAESDGTGSHDTSGEDSDSSPPKKAIRLKDRSSKSEDADAKGPMQSRFRIEDPLSLTDKQFEKTYGFEKPLAELVIKHVRPHLTYTKSANIWIMATLQQFVTGCKRLESSKAFGLSKSVVIRARRAVTDVLVELAKKHIKFPSSPEQLKHSADEFGKTYKIPEAVGVLYCTQIAVAMSRTAQTTPYLNPYGYLSLNVQLISNNSYRIVSCLPKYPGGTEDCNIWQSSQIRELFSNMYSEGKSNYKLVGAGDYLAEPWLLTPVGDTSAGAGEAEYNKALEMASQSALMTLGILKGRFRCLTKPFALTTTPIIAAKTVVACAVIHNLTLEAGDSKIATPPMKVDESDAQKLTSVAQETDDEDMILDEVGRAARSEYIKKYFSQ